MKEKLRGFTLAIRLAYRADPWRASAAFIVTGLAGLATTSFAYWIRLMTDGAVRGDASLALWAGIGAAGTFGLGILSAWSSFNLNISLHERTARLLDERMIELSAGAPGIEHHERPAYLAELELLRENRISLAQTSWSLAEGLGVIVRAGSTAALLATVHPILLALPIFALPSMLATARAQKRWHALQEEVAEPNRAVDHLFELATRAEPAKELRVFSLGDEITDRFARGRGTIEDAYMRERTRGAVLSSLGWSAFAVGYVLAIVFVVARAVAGDLSPGEVTQTMLLAAQVNQQAAGVVGIAGWLFQTLKAVGRFVWLQDYVREQRALVLPDDPAPVPDAIARGIDIEGLTFRYPGTEVDILRDVHLHIPAGSTVAIVGDNGAGKTTLVKLLARFYEPTDGRIAVDDVDLRRFDPDAWRARMSAGFQDFVRFELLARETVGVGALEHLDDALEVNAALARASATDVVETLPNGLETQLGKSFDAGHELSGGQWQKLALGRAMMRDAPLLLLLDEPTAALDAQTEHALFERYAGAARDAARATGAITILVSHRFSTVRMADLIVVIEDGRITQSGSHAELMALGGTYAELFELQARAYR